jgi:hypothetical protein
MLHAGRVTKPGRKAAPDLAERVSGEPLIEDAGDVLDRDGAIVAGIWTKMVRIAPLLRLNTSRSRSEERCTRSSRSSTTASSRGLAATPSSDVRTPRTWAARRRISSIAVRSGWSSRRRVS